MRNDTLRVITYAFFLLLFIACKKESVTTESYEFYKHQQQGWKSKQISQFISDINYTATEVPLQYYLLKNTEDPSKVDSIYTKNNRERIVEMEFQHADQTDLLLEDYTNRSYEDAVKYMAFTIKNDFKVVTSSNDTIVCAGVHFERNFKVAPFKRIMLYFNNINPDDTIKLIYQDNLYGNGIIKFNFNESPLKL